MVVVLELRGVDVVAVEANGVREGVFVFGELVCVGPVITDDLVVVVVEETLVLSVLPIDVVVDNPGPIVIEGQLEVVHRSQESKTAKSICPKNKSANRNDFNISRRTVERWLLPRFRSIANRVCDTLSVALN
jgi:hypothetical protein